LSLDYSKGAAIRLPDAGRHMRQILRATGFTGIFEAFGDDWGDC
jgi:hypothetical protein